MRIRPEYAHLIVGSKVGAGVQGNYVIDQPTRIIDPVLVLDESLEFYGPKLGNRMWLRIYHDGHNWKDPILWAQHCAIRMEAAYQYGCRNLITGNEQIALEGLGAEPSDYDALNTWGCMHLAALRAELAVRGCHGVRIWGPALSPGHQEDDGFEGYRRLEDYLRELDGIAVHNYWYPGGGFIGDPDAEWWSQRILRAHDLIEGRLGIVKPWAITEFNRKVDTGSNDDIADYAEQTKRYYQWVNSLDYVVAAFTFLYCRRDPVFSDLTWADMPTMLDRMRDGWDRRSEGEWSTPAPEPQPEEDKMNKYSVGPGIQAKIAEQGDTACSDEQWIGSVFSITFGGKGIYIYSKQANRTYFLPAR